MNMDKGIGGEVPSSVARGGVRFSLKIVSAVSVSVYFIAVCTGLVLISNNKVRKTMEIDHNVLYSYLMQFNIVVCAVNVLKLFFLNLFGFNMHICKLNKDESRKGHHVKYSPLDPEQIISPRSNGANSNRRGNKSKKKILRNETNFGAQKFRPGIQRDSAFW